MILKISLGFLGVSLVFFFGAINDLMLAYYIPTLPFFDFYTTIIGPFLIISVFKKFEFYEISIFKLFVLFSMFSFITLSIFTSETVYDTSGNSTISTNLYFLRKALPFFAIGLYISAVGMTTSESKMLSVKFYILVLVYSLIINWHQIKLDTSLYPNNSQWGNYHYLSECLVVMLFFSVSRQSNETKVTLLIIITTIILFALGSRASLFSFIIVVAILSMLSNQWTKVSRNVVLILITVSIIAYPIISDFVDRHYRMFSVLDSSTTEGSVVARRWLVAQGLNDIINNPILGSIGGQLNHGWNNLFEGYIHDFRSYYRQFGLVPFLCYSVLIIACNITSLLNYINKKDQLSFVTFAGILFFTIESLTSRSYLSPYIYVFIGMTIKTVLKAKNDT